jgi:hypothetical protein
MRDFLKANGIDAMPKWIPDGSLKRSWRLYNHAMPWTMELGAKLGGLGFRDLDNKALNEFSGNGGRFSVFVRGHEELLTK